MLPVAYLTFTPRDDFSLIQNQGWKSSLLLISVEKVKPNKYNCVFVTAKDPPYLIEVFEDYLYVTLHKSFRIVKIHKFHRNFLHTHDQKVEVVVYNTDMVSDILVLQPSKQKRTSKILILKCLGGGGGGRGY